MDVETELDKDIDSCGDCRMDDNDTIENTPESSYEEWEIKELDSFTCGAVTNLEVGLVDIQNYENGTWFVNRWISPPTDQGQPLRISLTQNCQNIQTETLLLLSNIIINHRILSYYCYYSIVKNNALFYVSI